MAMAARIDTVTPAMPAYNPEAMLSVAMVAITPAAMAMTKLIAQ